MTICCRQPEWELNMRNHATKKSLAAYNCLTNTIAGQLQLLDLVLNGQLNRLKFSDVLLI